MDVQCGKGMIRLRPEQVWTCNVTLHVHTCSGCNRIIPLMRRPNTDNTPNKPVTLRHDTVLRYAVTLQVCTHLYPALEGRSDVILLLMEAMNLPVLGGKFN